MWLHLTQGCFFEHTEQILKFVVTNMLLEIVTVHSSTDTRRTPDPIIFLYKVLFEGC